MSTNPARNPAEIRKELEESIGLAQWSEIEPHQNREAVIVVSHALELLEVGVKLAQDDKAVVASWIQQGGLAKPSLSQLETWAKTPDLKLLTLVVQPWVLVQSQAN
jgi:hypothetical protein